MPRGEALGRCPGLVLVPPDPAGVVEAWELALGRLEAIGAAVAPERPGLVCFEQRGLRRLLGGVEAAIAAAQRALRRPEARFGAGPSRFCALAAAARARPRRAEIVGRDAARARAYLPPLAIELLGIPTLGELAGRPGAAVADRFGAAGVQALELVRGAGRPPRPRVSGE